MLPAPEILKKLISYDPQSGYLTWLHRPVMLLKNDGVLASKRWNSRFAGKPALASFDSNGYLRGRVFGIDVKAHRAAWAIYYGVWPSGEIDHINGNPSDNSIRNLRDVPHSLNAKNKKLDARNTSGCPGVYWDRARNRWRVEIINQGSKHYLGQFVDLSAAVAARKTAEPNFQYHRNSGRSL